MIISIPNFKPVFGYLFFLGLLIGTIAISWDDIVGNREGIDTASIVITLIFGTVSIAFISLMSYRLKLITLSKSTVSQIHPFRFKSTTINFQDITNLNWGTWDGNNFGLYRKLIVQGSNDRQIELSDLEFSNFDTLQAKLLSVVNFEANLAKKRTVEIYQARTNRPINYFVIPLLVFFILLTVAFLEFENQFWMRISIIMILSGIVWRLTHKITLYNHWLKKFSKVRKRRLRKLKEQNKC